MATVFFFALLLCYHRFLLLKVVNLLTTCKRGNGATLSEKYRVYNLGVGGLSVAIIILSGFAYPGPNWLTLILAALCAALMTWECISNSLEQQAVGSPKGGPGE